MSSSNRNRPIFDFTSESCKQLRRAVKDTIDRRILNRGPSLKSVFKRNENLMLAVNSAEAIGCCVVNIGPEDIANATKHIVLGLVWQVRPAICRAF